MKKIRLIIKTLQEVGANGSFRLNDKYWLSSIDFANLCRALDLDPERTNTAVLVNSTVTVWVVSVPKAGITVKNPITGKDVVFKAHTEDAPVERLFAWQLQEFNVSESAVNLQRITMLQGKIRTIGSGQRAQAAEDEQIMQQDEQPEQQESGEEQPVAANADEEELPADDEDLPGA